MRPNATFRPEDVPDPEDRKSTCSTGAPRPGRRGDRARATCCAARSDGRRADDPTARGPALSAAAAAVARRPVPRVRRPGRGPQRRPRSPASRRSAIRFTPRARRASAVRITSRSPSTTVPTPSRRRRSSPSSTTRLARRRSSCSATMARRSPGARRRGRGRRPRGRGARRRAPQHAPAHARGAAATTSAAAATRSPTRPASSRVVPAAVRDPLVRRASRRARSGLTTVLWTTWGRDWRQEATPESVIADVLRRYVDGGTVLLHDSDCESYPGSWRSTLGALPKLADELRAPRSSRSAPSASTASRRAGVLTSRSLTCPTPRSRSFSPCGGVRYAAASVLQQRAAAEQPPELSLRPRCSSRSSAGRCGCSARVTDGGAYVLEARRWRSGRSSSSQPLLVTGLLWALPLATIGRPGASPGASGSPRSP